MTAGAASLVAGGAGRAWGEGTERGHDGEAAPRSRVVRIKSDFLFDDRGVHEDLLFELVGSLLKRITHEENVSDAWRSLLKPTDTIALKFNQSGAAGLGTADPMLRVLVRSLVEAGFKTSQLVAVEATPAMRQETETVAPSTRWSDETVDFGSGQDHLAGWLDDVTAIVNVPFLKHHNIAGMTCCLKNLSHAVVKHPAQYHANGCSPYIGDIVALPQVRGKLRLNIVDALRVVFDGGPDASEDFIWDAGILLGGVDPLAIDLVGLRILDEVRVAVGLPKIAAAGPPAYLEAAGDRGLGASKLHLIDLEQVSL